ncbi:MAG: peroxide stress protein YaaA [Actinobacteria bacterium]|uniref:Unannotated protein n=1 Tax=freshwater metagenome TaxID=449393 RepID=A0A6J7KUR1_9ZZZZ|nr:peroxide stress protein YaaA [Actinomycetota bacterium]MSW42505.1 peroxide stress protein YaaA [Actinomycetota bacterium]
MHILLPPSEGKSPPGRGQPLDLSSLSLPELTATRERVLAALVALARGPEARAREVLGLSVRQIDELARDARLESEPAAAARDVYSGVLYESLSLATLSPAARRRADRSLLISSGLFGAVRPGDRIPAYRLSGDTDLPGVGPLSALWRDPLAEALVAPLARGLVVDLRSGAYAAHFVIRDSLAARTATVRVLQETRVGSEIRRTIVSHHNKSTKGRLVRALLEAGASPKHPDALVAACRDLGFRAERGEPSRTGVASIDVVVAGLT